MIRSAKPASANRNGTAIALVGAAMRFVPMGVLTIASTPQGIESLSGARSWHVVSTRIDG